MDRIAGVLRWCAWRVQGVRFLGAGRIVLEAEVTLAPGSLVDARWGRVHIEHGTWIGPDVSVVAGTDTPAASRVGETLRIGRQARIGARAVLLPGTSIGPRAVVAPETIVAGSIPAAAIVAGCPARRVGHVLPDGAWEFDVLPRDPEARARD